MLRSSKALTLAAKLDTCDDLDQAPPAPKAPKGCLSQVAQTTFRAEIWRSVFSGVLEPAFGTFLLFIAVRHLRADPSAKAWLVAGPSVGLMLGPVLVAFVEWLRARVARAIACITAGGGLLLVAASFAQSSWAYVTLCAAAGICTTCTVPLMTQVYQNNYPAASRGKLFSDAFVLRIAVAALTSQILGWLLTRSPGASSWLLLAFALSAIGSALCWTRIPSEPLHPNPDATHPLRGFRYFSEDASFRRTLIAWMLMGTGNLIMLPLRVEQLARPEAPIFRHASEIAFLTAVLPNVARLVASPLWGRAFDRLNFFRMRAVLNLGFAMAVLAFFTGETTGWLVVGAILYGISTAGGDVAWTLFVTKMAPPERVADYMGVHTLLTGLRGVVAPVIAFHAVGLLSFREIGWICAALIFSANLVLLPELRPRASPTPGA